MSRLPVQKTYKLYIGGAFPRSESGRTFEVGGQNIARASRKDARDAVRAARVGGVQVVGSDRVQPRPGALPARRDDGDAGSRPRGGVLRRRHEVERSIDRVIWYAGWADKLAQVLGGANPVAGPYFNFTVPEPTGVVAIVAPGEPALEGLVSRLLPALVGGNTTVVMASRQHPLAAVELAEAVATSDMPAGAVNMLTGDPDELAPVLAAHMDVNAIDLTGAGDDAAAELERLAADNVKRVVRGPATGQSVWEIEPLMEAKTVWHPVGL